MDYSVSVVIPAHNEEKYVKRCIDSVRRSADEYGGSVEIIVVCNRCTDKTAEISRANGARVIFNDDRCIAKVRNDGIFSAENDIIVTIDCDNRMTRGTISEIVQLIKTQRYIGGGAPIRFERYSVPLFINDIMVEFGTKLTGLSCGIFWAEKASFEAIGGFADLRAMEDIETAKRLRKYGRSRGKKYGTLKNNYLINSTRKYDDLGDMLYFRLMVQNFGTIIKYILGDRHAADKLFDELFYDYNK